MFVMQYLGLGGGATVDCTKELRYMSKCWPLYNEAVSCKNHIMIISNQYKIHMYYTCKGTLSSDYILQRTYDYKRASLLTSLTSFIAPDLNIFPVEKKKSDHIVSLGRRFSWAIETLSQKHNHILSCSK